MRSSLRSDTLRLTAALGAVAVVTLTLSAFLRTSNAAIVSTTYLLVVLVVAATSDLRIAVVTSLAAMLCLNFFFLPPVGTFTIADPQNWIALLAFLAVSLVASHLSAVARARTREVVARRDELARLFDLSRDVLLITESREALSALARSIARRFDLEFIAIAVPRGGDWDVFDAGSRTIRLDDGQLSHALAAAQATLEFDAHNRTYAGHRTTMVDGMEVRLVPLRAGTRPIGVLAASGRPVEPGTLDTLAGLAAIAIERAQLLDERKAGERTRQSDELKTALLASIGHDLRTPLTAIRVAAGNIRASDLARDEVVDQSDLILTEIEHLTRLFENLLEMARIDAGHVATAARRTHPSEIVAAARSQVEQSLQRHAVEVTIEPDVPTRLDPRLTATALAHLLENAAHYSPAGSTVHVTARVDPEGLTIEVRDHGPGLEPADVPHLFERFYRGGAAKMRTSGTGMGLWIVRGLLAAEGGRIWADTPSGGGARFTMFVPAAAGAAAGAVSPA